MKSRSPHSSGIDGQSMFGVHGREAAILQHLPGAQLVLDEHWHILFANDAALTLLGYDSKDLLGSTVDKIIPEQLRERYRQLREDSARESPPNALLLRGDRIARTNAGLEVPIDLALSRLQLDGAILHLATFFDATATKRAEQETIERLHGIVEHADVGIFLIQITDSGEFLYEAFNSVTERLSGVRSEQARGRKPEQIVPVAEAVRVTENYRRCQQLGIPITYEESPGDVVNGRVFRTTLVPVRNPDGRVYRLVGLSQDITDQKRAEVALARAERSRLQSEEKFRKAFSASPNPISITELNTGKLLEINDAFERVFGYGRDEALGKTTSELNLWRDPAARERMVAMLQDAGAFRNFESEGVHRSGRVMTLILSGEIVDLDGVRCLVTYVNDVTEDRANKRELAESRERLSKAFLVSPDALAIVEGSTGNFLDVNEGFLSLFGRTREEVLGRSSKQLELWESPEERERALEILRAEGRLRDFAIQGVHKNGDVLECLMSAEQLEVGGRRCAVAVIRDVTAARRAERAREELERRLRQNQKLDALGTLAGGIAHDFNNILGAILAYAELIKLDVRQPELVESHLVELKNAGNRAADLVRQILTFSRKQPLQSRRAMVLEGPVHEVLQLVRAAVSATIQLDVEVSPATPVVLADATQVHQLVMNLCTNAAHAMRNGQGRLGVRLEAVQVDAALRAQHPELQEGRYARLTISDTGEGIAPDVQKRIFEPFFTTKAQGEGTGLGMAVVHGIVREHEGVIVLESSEGQGTKVFVYLPEYEEQLRQSVKPKSELTRGRGERVLLVDDEQVLCRSVSNLLERLGYRVEAFTDPLAALATYRERPAHFDVIVTDFRMPGMTGFELAREVHALSPATPIVVMTGFGGGESDEFLRGLGIRQILIKPLNVARIANSINACLATANTHSTGQVQLSGV